MSPGRRGIMLSIGKMAVHRMGPFRAKSCRNRELVNSTVVIHALSFNVVRTVVINVGWNYPL